MMHCTRNGEHDATSHARAEQDANAAQVDETAGVERVPLVADDQAAKVPSQAKSRSSCQRRRERRRGGPSWVLGRVRLRRCGALIGGAQLGTCLVERIGVGAARSPMSRRGRSSTQWESKFACPAWSYLHSPCKMMNSV